MKTPHIVGIGGTTRAGSSTERAVRFALAACEAEGATTSMFAGPELVSLPFYAPESPERTDGARAFVDELRRADGVIVGSSAYHGSVSGLVKNALDYTEDLREDARVYLSGMPVGCVATGAGWQGIVNTLSALRAIAHSLRGWPTPLGAAINTAEPAFGPDGEPLHEYMRFQLTTLAEEVVGFARLSALEHAD
jgi:FMN reductase